MKTWGTGLAGIALACVLTACGGGDGGTDANSFTISASVGGTKVQSFSGGSGQTTTLTVKSGQDLRFDASNDVVWASVNASQTEVTLKGSSTQSWTAGLKSPPGGTVTLVVTSAKDSNKSATVTVTVSPHEYTSATPQALGRVTTWTETTTQVGGTTATHERANTTTAVDATTGAATMQSTVDAVADELYKQDADGNRLQRTRTNGDVCTYSPKRTLVSFPLSVGKSWTSTWTYTCTPGGYHETVNTTSTIEAYEPVTTPMGTLNALRIHHVEAVSNSNDAALQNGGAGNAAYNIDLVCWWDVAGQRTVKCNQADTYQGGIAPANYTKTFTQVLKSVQ